MSPWVRSRRIGCRRGDWAWLLFYLVMVVIICVIVINT